MAQKPEKIKKEIIIEEEFDKFPESIIEESPPVEKDFEIIGEKDVKESVKVAIVMEDKLIVINSKEEGILISRTSEHKNVKVGDFINI